MKLLKIRSKGVFKLKLLAVCTSVLLTSSTLAQSFQLDRKIVCDKQSEVFKIIASFGERPVWYAKTSEGLVSILTLNPSTQTWSILITDNQIACLVESGEGFQVMPNVEQKTDVPKNFNQSI